MDDQEKDKPYRNFGEQDQRQGGDVVVHAVVHAVEDELRERLPAWCFDTDAGADFSQAEFWQWAGPKRALGDSILSDTSSLTDLGMIFGAMAAAALSCGA